MILNGRLTRDPDVRYTDGGHTVARFSVAVDRKYKKEGDSQTADFPSIVAFGKTAEFIEKYFRQGSKIIIEGRLQTGSYTNKDGQKVYTTDVIADAVEFGDSKNSSESSGQGSGTKAPNLADADGFMNIPDAINEELPFN